VYSTRKREDKEMEKEREDSEGAIAILVSKYGQSEIQRRECETGAA